MLKERYKLAKTHKDKSGICLLQTGVHVSAFLLHFINKPQTSTQVAELYKC